MSDSEKKQENDSHAAQTGAIVRIIDASINRSCEGLRVVEDYVRMVLEDRFLSQQLKILRHDLVDTCRKFDSRSRLLARDSELDVGRNVQVDAEYHREDLESILRANMTRAQQATRTIEEYCKIVAPEIVKAIEQIRYRAYTVEKAIFQTAFNRSRFADAKLYVLVDAFAQSSGFDKLRSLVLALVDAKVDLIQLRDKRLSDAELVAAGKMIAALTASSETLFVVNDRADLCVASGADGVHLGQTDVSVHQARMLLRSHQFVGVSTHSVEQARRAVIDGADYIGVGPVFESSTKSFDSHVGVKLVSEISEQIALPCFAIGGINQSNASAVVAAGCHRIAVSAAVCGADDPAAAARSLRDQL